MESRTKLLLCSFRITHEKIVTHSAAEEAVALWDVYEIATGCWGGGRLPRLILSLAMTLGIRSLAMTWGIRSLAMTWRISKFTIRVDRDRAGLRLQQGQQQADHRALADSCRAEDGSA